MDFKDFQELRAECSKNCKTVDIDHCTECAFKSGKTAEWNYGELPAQKPVVCRVDSDGKYAYKVSTVGDNAPSEVNGWYEIPDLDA